MRTVLAAIFFSFFAVNLGHACVSLGSPKPTDCINEVGGKNCSCLQIRNDCTKRMSAKYTVTGASPGSVIIDPGKTNTEACTTKRGQTVTYVGYVLHPGTAAKAHPECERLKEAATAASERRHAHHRTYKNEEDSCKLLVVYRRSLELVQEWEIAINKAKAGCGGSFAGAEILSRAASESVSSRRRLIEDYKDHCAYDNNKRRGQSSTSSPSRGSSSSTEDVDPSLLSDGRIDCFGGCQHRKPGSDITGTKRK